MRLIKTVASAITLALILSNSSFAQSCSGSSDFASGYSSYSSPVMYSGFASSAPAYNVTSSYPSIMSSSPMNYGMPVSTPAPIYSDYSSQMNHSPVNYSTMNYSSSASYSAPISYPSVTNPSMFSQATYSAPAPASYTPAPTFSPAPISSCQNGNCSQPGISGAWNFGF